MKSAHNNGNSSTRQKTNVNDLDKSLESMREQIQKLELEIDEEVSNKTNDVGVGTGDSLIIHKDIATDITQVHIITILGRKCRSSVTSISL